MFLLFIPCSFLLELSKTGLENRNCKKKKENESWAMIGGINKWPFIYSVKNKNNIKLIQ